MAYKRVFWIESVDCEEPVSHVVATVGAHAGS